MLEWKQLAFSPADREAFRDGSLAPAWAARYPQLFDAADLRMTVTQPRYHFYEWLAAVSIFEETGYLSNVIGSGSTHGQAVFIGADNVYEAISIPEEIRMKNSTDYGRDLGLAWYALLGFKLVWSYSTDTEQHVVFVTSA